MALWRNDDPEVFSGAIAVAAERLNVQPLVVEKDYWVCEILRAVAAVHGEQIVFKGGTSLEKLRITSRFSEDIDLLVVGEHSSKNAAKTELRRIQATAASVVGGACSDEKSGGDPGPYWRKAYLELPLEYTDQTGGLADPRAVLLELGRGAGPQPSQAARVESLLSRELASTALDGQWEDLQPFEVTILHPGRTLIEKLLRVNNFGVDPAKRAKPNESARIGRQFYDIWAQLGDPRVTDLLADTELVGEILESIFRVSLDYDGDHPLPDGGFAASTVFDAVGEFAADLRLKHDTAMNSLYFGADPPPTFDDVLDRIHSCAELLDPGRRTPGSK